MSMTEHAIVKLRKDGDEISAHVSIPGAIVAATGASTKDALQMLADALDENDEPFWSATYPRRDDQ